MNDLNKTEKRFSEELSKIRWELDTDTIWEGIKDDLPKEDKRRRGVFFWWAGIGSLALLALSIFVAISIFASSDEGTLLSTETLQTSDSINSSSPTALKSLEDEKEGFFPSATRRPNETQGKATIKSNTIRNTDAFNPPSWDTNKIKPLQPDNRSGSRSLALLQDLKSKNRNPLLYNRTPITLRKRLFPILNMEALSLRTLSFERKLSSQSIQVIHRLPSPAYFIMASMGSHLSSWNYMNTEGNLRAADEMALPGLSGSLQVGKYMNRHIFLTTGIQFNQSYARYENEQSISSVREVEGVARIDINAFGQETTTTGPISEYTRRTHAIQWHRRHLLLNVFVGGGIDLLPKSNWILSVQSNLHYTIWSKHQGYYYSNDLASIERFDNSSLHPYEREGHWAIQGGFRFGYQFNNWGVFTQYSYQRNLGSFTPANYAYSLNSSKLGLELGMVYRPHWE